MANNTEPAATTTAGGQATSSHLARPSSPVVRGQWSVVSGLQSMVSSPWSLVLSLALLWFILIHQLWSAWGADPQYAYGFVVPVLCMGLLLRRWQVGRDHGLRTTDYGLVNTDQGLLTTDYGLRTAVSSRFLLSAFCFLLFPLLPLRLIIE